MAFREQLQRQSPEWLADELIARLVSVQAEPRAPSQPLPQDAAPGVPAGAAGAAGLDEAGVRAFLERRRPLCRDRLEVDGYLRDAPRKGSTLIASACRTPKGDDL